jgi:site-specific DNA-methyltransferase (adenine-specific)
MEFMKEVPDKFYDLAVVDPPYGIGEDKLHSKRRLSGAGKLKNRAINKLNTEWDHSIPSEEYFNELFRISKNQIIWGGNYFNLPPTRGVIAWDKVQPWSNFSQWEMGWTSFDCPAKIYKFDNRTGNKIHPTQKPVKLYEWILKNYAKEGDKILDTHGGSQSSRIACYNLGYALDIIELDQEYFDKGNKRFETHKQQLTIF